MSGYVETRINGLNLRFAEEQDTELILRFIKELADFEELSDEVVATEDTLRESLFERRVAEVILAEYEDIPVGFALFFYNFSTFVGRPGIYLEDLYVIPEMRGKGIGKVLLSYLARIAVERKCRRLEWSVLDWNEPAIKFYRHLGAIPMDEWTVNRVTGEALTKLAKSFKE